MEVVPLKPLVIRGTVHIQDTVRIQDPDAVRLAVSAWEAVAVT